MLTFIKALVEVEAFIVLLALIYWLIFTDRNFVGLETALFRVGFGVSVLSGMAIAGVWEGAGASYGQVSLERSANHIMEASNLSRHLLPVTLAGLLCLFVGLL